jgi:hypothetical protein
MPTWIRVKDDATGDEYDIDPASLRGGMTVLKHHPMLTGDGALPRPTKVHVDKAGNRLPLNPLPPEPVTKPKSDTATPAPPADIEE